MEKNEKSKYFLTSDWHLGFKKNSTVWFDYFLETVNKFLIPTLKENKTGSNDKLIILGDVFHDRYSVGNRIISPVLDIFRTLSDIIDIHIITGNHDLFSNTTNKYCSIDILGEFATIHKEPFILDNSVLLLPFLTSNVSENVDTVIRRFKGEYPDLNLVLSHSFFGSGTGTSSFQNTVENINESDLQNTVSCFKDFPDIKFISGHIHKIISKNNTLHIGSLLSNTYSDVGEKKGLFIYDNFSRTVSFIENIISPTFKDIDLKTFLKYDIDKFKTDFNNSFVRLIFNNNERNRLNMGLLKEVFGDSILGFSFKREYTDTNRLSEDSNEIDVSFLFDRDEIWRIVEQFISTDNIEIKKIIEGYFERIRNNK